MGEKAKTKIGYTRKSFSEFLICRGQYHEEMMRMFRKTASSTSWGFRGHYRGARRAFDTAKVVLEGGEISCQTIAAYLGKGARLLD